jgi:hypothetical protein
MGKGHTKSEESVSLNLRHNLTNLSSHETKSVISYINLVSYYFEDDFTPGCDNV